ncbi:MAG: LysE family transporter [Sulfurovum sp.]|nr:LysE family transporter [Sulfurovum sp.]MDD3602722.1 LysE family transporter [Sulfurovum sp.]
MIFSFMEGFLLGAGAAVPLGPINLLIMNEAIREYKNGVMIGLGAMSADITYLLFILFGIIAYLNQPIVLNAISLAGGIFLLYLAWSIFKGRKKPIADIAADMVQKNTLKLYVKGYLLTLLNPYTIAFWLSAAGYVAGKNLDFLVTFLGLFSAIFLWITLMPLIIYKTKHKISHTLSHRIHLVSSLILFGFGAMMLMNFVSHLH